MTDDDPALNALRSLDRPRPMPPSVERRVRARLGSAWDGHERGDHPALDHDGSPAHQVVLEPSVDSTRDRWRRPLTLVAAAMVVAGLAFGVTRLGNNTESRSAVDAPASPVGVFCGTHLSAYLQAFEDFQGPGLDASGARLGREEALLDALGVLAQHLTRLADEPDRSAGLADDVAGLGAAVVAAQEQLEAPTPVLVSAIGVAHIQLEGLVRRHLNDNPDCASADLAWQPLG